MTRLLLFCISLFYLSCVNQKVVTTSELQSYIKTVEVQDFGVKKDQKETVVVIHLTKKLPTDWQLLASYYQGKTARIVVKDDLTWFSTTLPINSKDMLLTQDAKAEYGNQAPMPKIHLKKDANELIIHYTKQGVNQYYQIDNPQKVSALIHPGAIITN